MKTCLITCWFIFIQPYDLTACFKGQTGMYFIKDSCNKSINRTVYFPINPFSFFRALIAHILHHLEYKLTTGF